MKQTIYSIIGLLILAMTINSCVNDTDYDTPQITIPEPELTGNEVSLENVLTEWQNNIETQQVKVFDDDYEDYIAVYVTSSDEHGNFYKELFVQDSFAAPNAAIKVNVNIKSLYTKYEVGRKMYIYLKGLAIGKNQSGEVVLSEAENGQLAQYIRENVAKTHFVKGPEKETIAPVPVESPLAVNSTLQGKYVRLNTVMFELDILGENFTDPNDSYDTQRKLVCCLDNSTIELETSSYASFKNSPLPMGMGSVDGIITRDYGDDMFVLKVNNDEVFMFDNERCDPESIDCGYADTEGSTYLLTQYFEDQNPNELISADGWTNYIQEGSKGWQAFSSTGSNPSIGVSARIGSYNSDDDSSIAWLITPLIDLDAQEGETLTFKTSNSYADGSNLEILYSSDWDGTPENIASATWGIIPAAKIVPDEFFYGDWYDSGIVDLSCAEGSIYIAFKYTGNGNADFDGTYELDNIEIKY